MRAAHILFMSDERLPCEAEKRTHTVQAKYGNEIVVIGMGAEGALLSVKADGATTRVAAAHVRPVVNTIGAGDALLSAFLHFYATGGNPYGALRRAVVFAGYKVGEAGAAGGFLDETGTETLYSKT